MQLFALPPAVLEHLGDERAPKLIGGFLIAQVYRGRPTFQARIITLDVASALRRRRIAWALMQNCEEELAPPAGPTSAARSSGRQPARPELLSQVGI